MSKRLPGDTRVADIAHAQIRKDQRTRGAAIRTLSEAEVQARVSRSVNVGNPADNTHTLSQEMESMIQLRITEVIPYDRNPRQHENERYNDIKESIRVTNVLAPLVVTRRPGSARYMVAAGGNTRLKAQQELWAETGDPRFEYLLGIYRPWGSEITTMVAHLAENELRGGLTFWDRANGLWALKQELEAVEGKLSLRQLHKEMRGRGLKVSITLLSFSAFAIEQLGDLGPATTRLTQSAMRELQPSFNQLQRYVTLHGHDEAEWANLRAKALKPLASILAQQTYEDDTDDPEGGKKIRPLESEPVISVLEQAVALHLGQSVAEVQALRQLAGTYPKASLEELRLRHHQGTLAFAPAPAPERPAPSARSTGAQGTPAAAFEPGPGAVEPARPAPAPAAPPQPPQAPSPASLRPEAMSAPGSAPAPSPGDDPRTAVMDAAIAFTRACGAADLLRVCPPLPHGYYMEIPADGGFLDGDEAQPFRHMGWWLAAMHSGQIDGTHSEHMPVGSLWRQVQRMENGHDENALAWHIETALGNPPGLVELGAWFMHCPEHVLTSHEQLLRSLRRLSEGEPQ